MLVRLRLIYLTILLIYVVLTVTLFLTSMSRNQCITTEIGKGQLAVVPEQATVREEWKTKFARVIEERKIHMHKMCNYNDNVTSYLDVRKHLLYNEKKNVVFCYVPKVASTLWKTVFHLIDKPGLSHVELGKGILHPRKDYIHMVSLPLVFNIRPFSRVFAFLTNATRVVFSRDPYARLFSAYVGKLILSFFWKDVGMAIVKSQRRGANTLSKECGHDVTFEEFLRYVVYVNSKPELIPHLSPVEDHWMPVSWICQPCQMDYNFIGKIETLSSDRDSVLGDVMGLRETVHYLRSNRPIVENSLNQAINTSWPALIFHKKCITKADIMSRLWRYFKIQGYLPMALPLPSKILSHGGTNSETKEIFRAFVLDSYKKHGLTHEESSAQKRAAMANAYQALDFNVKKDIVRTFVRDFEIFNYEKYPEDLYRFDKELVNGIQN